MKVFLLVVALLTLGACSLPTEYEVNVTSDVWCPVSDSALAVADSVPAICYAGKLSVTAP